MRTLLVSSLLLFFLVGCGALQNKEVGRIAINEANDELQEIELELRKSRPVELWADLQLEFDDEIQLYYNIEVWQGENQVSGQRINGLELEPMMTMEKNQKDAHHSWNLIGKIGEVELIQNGTYTVKASINTSDNATLQLKKVHLVLKQ